MKEFKSEKEQNNIPSSRSIHPKETIICARNTITTYETKRNFFPFYLRKYDYIRNSQLSTNNINEIDIPT